MCKQKSHRKTITKKQKRFNENLEGVNTFQTGQPFECTVKRLIVSFFFIGALNDDKKGGRTNWVLMILTESFHQMPNAIRKQSENVRRTYFDREWCYGVWHFYATTARWDIADFIFQLLLRWFVIWTTRPRLIRIVIFFLRHHRQLLFEFRSVCLWCWIRVIDWESIIFKWTPIGLCHFRRFVRFLR